MIMINKSFYHIIIFIDTNFNCILNQFAYLIISFTNPLVRPNSVALSCQRLAINMIHLLFCLARHID